MSRSRALMAAGVIAASLSLALSGCSGLKGSRSGPIGAAQNPSQATVQTEQQADEVDRLLQELANGLRSTDTLPDVPELSR